MESIKAHWPLIAACAGLYAALATILVRKIPMPASGWKRFAHRLFLDWPAALPALDMKGIFGLPFNVPYLTLSQAAQEVIGQVLKVLLPLAFLLATVPSCAQYSACVKQESSPTFKALTAATIEQQVIGILNLAVSEQWVQLGLQAASDACADTNCKSLVACVAVAWQEAHPLPTATKAAVNQKLIAAHRGIEAYKAAHPSAMRSCRHVAVATILDEVPICDNHADAFSRECRPIVDHNLPELE